MKMVGRKQHNVWKGDILFSCSGELLKGILLKDIKAPQALPNGNLD